MSRFPAQDEGGSEVLHVIDAELELEKQERGEADDSKES
jgi:hypothetical protein